MLRTPYWPKKIRMKRENWYNSWSATIKIYNKGWISISPSFVRSSQRSQTRPKLPHVQAPLLNRSLPRASLSHSSSRRPLSLSTPLSTATIWILLEHRTTWVNWLAICDFWLVVPRTTSSQGWERKTGSEEEMVTCHLVMSTRTSSSLSYR